MEIRMDASVSRLDFGSSHIPPGGACLQGGSGCLGGGGLVRDGVGGRHATITRIGELCGGERRGRLGRLSGKVHCGGGDGRGECGRGRVDAESKVAQCFLELSLPVDGQTVGTQLE